VLRPAWRRAIDGKVTKRDFGRECDTSPAVAIKLLRNLAAALSGRLRETVRTIDQLEAWLA